ATIALCLVIGAASWYLLQQLAMLLRPLLLAVFLAYLILPVHHRLTQSIPRYASLVVMAGGSVAVLYGLALVVYSSAVELSGELARYVKTVQAMYDEASTFWNEHMAWFGTASDSGKGPTVQTEQLRSLTAWVVNAATDALKDAVVVGFYLLFLLL